MVGLMTDRDLKTISDARPSTRSYLVRSQIARLSFSDTHLELADSFNAYCGDPDPLIKLDFVG